jgi:uncharacterized protein (DUF885 family)
VQHLKQKWILGHEPNELRPPREQQPPTPEQRAPLDVRADQEKNAEKNRAEQRPERTESASGAEQGKKRFFNPLKKQPAPVSTMGKDELSAKIEKVLEENIADAYQRLSPSGKQAFKIKGEKTANAVKEMISQGHSKARKIFTLILEWLRMLPGVNRFFLEQEAKIKTDRLIKLGAKK